jgi:hypothetical protein
MALIERAIVKSDWLNIPSADTTHDALIDRMIAMATSEIEGICNQPILQTATTFYFQGSARNIQRLPYTTNVVLTSLSARMLPSDSWANVTGASIVPAVAGSVYSIYSEEVLSSNFYRLIADVGYASAPEDIKLCAYEMVKELYYRTPFAAEAERFGVTAISETDAGVAITKAIVQIRQQVKPRLERYIVHGI